MIAAWRSLPGALVRARTVAALAAIVSLAVSMACGESRGRTDPDTTPAVSVSVALPLTALRVGDTLRANAEAFDSAGRHLVGLATRWETSDGRVASVSSSGLVLAVGPGVATISAVVGAARGTVVVEVQRPLALNVTVSPDSVSVAASVVVQLDATARDAAGQAIPTAVASWYSSAPSVASVDASGRVTALAAGRAEIVAAVDDVAGRAVVVVTRPSSVLVASVAPALLTPGATVTIVGAGFSPNRTSNAVTVGGVAATVRTASATQITATVATTGYACAPTADVPVVVVSGESGARAVALQVATPRTLADGQAIVLADPAQAGCNELLPASGRYVVAVFNPTATSAAASFSLRGAPSAIAAAPAVVRNADTRFRVAAAAAPTITRGDAIDDPGRPSVAASAAPGDTVTFQVLAPSARSCNDAAAAVRARTVAVGRRVAVYEDVASPLAGTMDDDFRAIAQEFDDITFPLVESTFGNPLAFDARIARTGRVALLFTPDVNARAGTLGVSLSCDLLPASSARASNEQQIVYLVVPTSTAAGLGDGRATGTRGAWRQRIRAVAAHETKHVASYAERLARGLPFEEPWLEEGSALVAEELFARAVRGLPLRANTTFSQSLDCELRAGTECVGLPVAFSDHFARLAATLADPGQLPPVVADLSLDPGGAFYGGAWWLLRWSADHFGASDGAFFRALTAGPQTGVENLAARAGRPWRDLLGEWWLATALDDRPGFTPPRPTLAEPSWHLRDVLAGAGASGDPRFPSPFPLQSRALAFGDFLVDVPNGVRGSGAVFFELGGAASARQLLELRAVGTGGGGPPLGIAIARVP